MPGYQYVYGVIGEVTQRIVWGREQATYIAPEYTSTISMIVLIKYQTPNHSPNPIIISKPVEVYASSEWHETTVLQIILPCPPPPPQPLHHTYSGVYMPRSRIVSMYSARTVRTPTATQIATGPATPDFTLDHYSIISIILLGGSGYFSLPRPS